MPMLKRTIAVLLLSSGLASGAQAGCLAGAAAGGVVGHMAGHHGLIGAAVGCAVGHHHAAKERQANQQRQDSQSPSH
jgi:phage tail tape-measure protein